MFWVLKYPAIFAVCLTVLRYAQFNKSFLSHREKFEVLSLKFGLMVWDALMDEWQR
jgi:hypothetical protein